MSSLGRLTIITLSIAACSTAMARHNSPADMTGMYRMTLYSDTRVAAEHVLLTGVLGVGPVHAACLRWDPPSDSRNARPDSIEIVTMGHDTLTLLFRGGIEWGYRMMLTPQGSHLDGWLIGRVVPPTAFRSRERVVAIRNESHDPITCKS
jgi:hypothetical protein